MSDKISQNAIASKGLPPSCGQLSAIPLGPLSRAGLAGVFLVTAFFLIPPALSLAEDYAFRDRQGNEVQLPQGQPIYSRKNPGPWAKLSAIHEPKVEWSSRKVGLEDIRILKLSFSHPSSEKEGRLEKIYLADKDGLVIGYKIFTAKDKNYKAEFQLNGVINYVKIYIECSRHGLWGAEVRP